MARFEDLDLDPDEGPSDPTRPSPDARRLLDEIEELMSDREYNWATETLNGIWETVKRTGVASENQQRAIANIKSGGEGRDRHGVKRSRRYEGWGR